MDEDPLDTKIDCEVLDGCAGMVVVTIIGAVVVGIGLILSSLIGLGVELP